MSEASRKATIYGLRKDGKIVYVGRTLYLANRTRVHRSRGVDFDEVVALESVDQADCVAAENEAIKKHNPPLNRYTNGNGNIGIIVRESEGIELIKRINITLPNQLHKAAVCHGRKRGMTFSALLARLLVIELERAGELP